MVEEGSILLKKSLCVSIAEGVSANGMVSCYSRRCDKLFLPPPLRGFFAILYPVAVQLTRSSFAPPNVTLPSKGGGTL